MAQVQILGIVKADMHPIQQKWCRAECPVCGITYLLTTTARPGSLDALQVASHCDKVQVRDSIRQKQQNQPDDAGTTKYDLAHAGFNLSQAMSNRNLHEMQLGITGLGRQHPGPSATACHPGHCHHKFGGARSQHQHRYHCHHYRHRHPHHHQPRHPAAIVRRPAPM